MDLEVHVGRVFVPARRRAEAGEQIAVEVDVTRGGVVIRGGGEYDQRVRWLVAAVAALVLATPAAAATVEARAFAMPVAHGYTLSEVRLNIPGRVVAVYLGGYRLAASGAWTCVRPRWAARYSFTPRGLVRVELERYFLERRCTGNVPIYGGFVAHQEGYRAEWVPAAVLFTR